jgi:FtsZ-binding cell division protein ZapB
MEDVQEGFLDQHARERLKREQEVLEKEHAKHQKKIESRDFFAELNAKYKDKEFPYGQ